MSVKELLRAAQTAIRRDVMQLALRGDGREMKSHGDYGFPLLISLEHLSAYEMSSFACHWHPELEFTLIL